MGDTSFVGKSLILDGRAGHIVGIMKDFIFRPLNNKTWPLAFMLDSDKVRQVSIRIQKGEISSSLDLIEKTWKQTVPMFPFIYSFLDTDFDKSFRAIETLSKLLTMSTITAIFISCLGILGLASYSAQQRTKEIGVRKVLGATTTRIVLMLSHEFTKWVIIANVIAFPVAYFVMNRWLQDFANRTSMGLWVFILSALLALVLAILTVFFQAFKAGAANPADSLRYE